MVEANEGICEEACTRSMDGWRYGFAHVSWHGSVGVGQVGCGRATGGRRSAGSGSRQLAVAQRGQRRGGCRAAQRQAVRPGEPSRATGTGVYG